MKKLVSFGLSFVTISLLAGCATSTANYTAPLHTSTPLNSKNYSIPFDDAWDKLVKNLSSDFFVINNIDKNSRLINVSFSSQKPSDFIDCGSTLRTFKNARGDQQYSYFAADSAQFTTTNGQGIVANVNRKTKLDGRVNIYVAPEEKGTIVNVNTKYILGVEMHIYPLGGSPLAPSNFTADFSTKTSYSGTDFSCYTKGTIENRVFAFLEK